MSLILGWETSAMLSSIRTKLTMYSLAITIAVLVVLVSLSYVLLRNLVRSNQIDTAYHNVRITMDNIDRDIGTLKNMLIWLSINTDVNYFVNPSPQDRKPLQRSLKAYDVIRNSSYGTGLSEYINKLLVVDRKGASIQMGNVQGDSSDAIVFSGLTRTGAVNDAGALVRDPFWYSRDELVIPLSRPIFLDDEKTQVGQIGMTVSTKLIIRNLAEQTFDDGSEIYIAMGGKVFKVDETHRFSVVEDSVFVRDLIAGLGTAQQTWFDVKADNSRTFVYYTGPNSGWTMLQGIPYTRLPLHADTYFQLLILVALCVFFLIIAVMFLVDRTVNRPIALINKRLDAISEGNFAVDPSIEFKNEFGDIGRGINRMSRNIETLIENTMKDAATKRDLEFKILQNQINPHFLYNTLSSIKWMAEIQKVPGIAEMAGSLATLLKHLSKGTDEMVSIAQELALVKEYLVIQQYRSGNLAETVIEIEDEALLSFGIVKFTLQPIVENAIVHGIEPTRKPGTITIRVGWSENGSIEIEVRDDGCGIDKKTLDQLFDLSTQDPPDPGGAGRTHAGDIHNKATFNHIGLKNVSERIRLRFGKDFGLRIASASTGPQGSFTSVRVLIPRILLQNEKREANHA